MTQELPVRGLAVVSVLLTIDWLQLDPRLLLSRLSILVQGEV